MMTLQVFSFQEFQATFFKQLNFTGTRKKHCTVYQNQQHKASGHFLRYARKGYYELGIADYTIPHPFKIEFENTERLVRFGIVYKGTTEFQLEDQEISSFTPSSFFLVEQDVKGVQSWMTGQHFHGTEITIYESYFNDVVSPLLDIPFNFDHFVLNHTYNFLPLEMVSILQTIQAHSDKNSLDPLTLESFILQCVAVLMKTATDYDLPTFTTQLYHGQLTIGQNRHLSITTQDIKRVQHAHHILTNEIKNPPTIETLSESVQLNSQKLKALFKHQYHMSVGEYMTSVKMTTAANLLCTTDLSISEVSQYVGYHYPANFIKMFRTTYDVTPLKYRQANRNLYSNKAWILMSIHALFMYYII